jgi:hypothetical protein
MSDSEHGDQFVERLAGIAANSSIVEAVHSLPGGSTFAAFLQRETDAYIAQAGDGWTDAGLAAWVAERQAEMNRAWSADVARVTGDPPPAEIEAPSSSEILEAAEAWRREGVEVRPDLAAILFQAVTNRRGPFALFVERETAAARRNGEDINEHMAQHRDEMRRLFRADVEAVVREARGW